nr:MAG TPA: hypothetical protein [Caudoviricetes sp.]
MVKLLIIKAKRSSKTLTNYQSKKAISTTLIAFFLSLTKTEIPYIANQSTRLIAQPLSTTILLFLSLLLFYEE